jgi:hypothetical protein
VSIYKSNDSHFRQAASEGESPRNITWEREPPIAALWRGELVHAQQNEHMLRLVEKENKALSLQESLLVRLLSAGDIISIESGRLNIISASGISYSADWMQAHHETLVCEILKAVSLDAYYYESYSTGHYGKHKAGGVTIQFVSVLAGESAYVVFNADLKRIRGEKKGSPLPSGQFRVTKRCHFYKFWLRAGLGLPPRLSSFHDYMGNLRGILFSGNTCNERMDAGVLSPLNVRAEWIKKAIAPPDSTQTTPGHHPDNLQTRTPDNELLQARAGQRFQPDSSAGDSIYGKKVIRETGVRGDLCTPENPAEQSVEEWQAAYGI